MISVKQLMMKVEFQSWFCKNLNCAILKLWYLCLFFSLFFSFLLTGWKESALMGISWHICFRNVIAPNCAEWLQPLMYFYVYYMICAGQQPRVGRYLFVFPNGHRKFMMNAYVKPYIYRYLYMFLWQNSTIHNNITLILLHNTTMTTNSLLERTIISLMHVMFILYSHCCSFLWLFSEGQYSWGHCMLYIVCSCYNKS